MTEEITISGHKVKGLSMVNVFCGKAIKGESIYELIRKDLYRQKISIYSESIVLFNIETGIHYSDFDKTVTKAIDMSEIIQVFVPTQSLEIIKLFAERCDYMNYYNIVDTPNLGIMSYKYSRESVWEAIKNGNEIR